MKFSLVAIGSRFEYQGQIYTKTTPLVAAAVDTGTQKLIPRSASVQLIDAVPTERVTPSSVNLSRQVVGEALDLALQTVKDDLRGTTTAGKLQETITRARQVFYAKLDATPD